jgi:Flp pilus assembly protein TadG
MRTSRSRTGTLSRRKRQSGSVMLEFALSALLLTSVFTGTFQFGYTFYVYNKLVTGVSAGARYASLHALTNDNNQTVPSSFSSDVKNMVVYGTPNPEAGAATLAPGLTTANVEVTVTFIGAGTSSNRPSEVRVQVMNYQVNAVFRTFTFSSKPSITMPYFGSYCPEVATCP